MDGLYVITAGYPIELPSPPFITEKCSEEKQLVLLAKQKEIDVLILEQSFCHQLLRFLDYIRNLQPHIHIILISEDVPSLPLEELARREVAGIFHRSDGPDKIVSICLDLMQGKSEISHLSNDNGGQQSLFAIEENNCLNDTIDRDEEVDFTLRLALEEVDKTENDSTPWMQDIILKLRERMNKYVEENLAAVVRREIEKNWQQQGIAVVTREIESIRSK